MDVPYEIYCYSGTVFDELPWTIADGSKATPEETPIGTTVPSSPVDPNTGALVALLFDNVTAAGATIVTTKALEGVMDPPEGYRIGDSDTLFFISTTAIYDGFIEIALPYTTEVDPALFHYVDGAWVDVTTSVDSVNKIIHGVVTSLSPFAVFERNTAPGAIITAPASGQLVHVGEEVALEAMIIDPDPVEWHAAVWTILDEKQNVIQVIDGNVEGGAVQNTVSLDETGIYFISLTVVDMGGASDTTDVVNDDPDLSAMFVVYDPSGGFVTGGGWIQSPAGAFAAAPELEGKANFGFVSKYAQGANVPTGNTEFQFKAGALNFKSTEYQWLVVAGARAKFKGWGTVNGMEGYGFMLTGIDDDLLGGNQPDRFRIKIWEIETGAILYDNQAGTDDDAGLDTDGTLVQGGNVVVHK